MLAWWEGRCWDRNAANSSSAVNALLSSLTIFIDGRGWEQLEGCVCVGGHVVCNLAQWGEGGVIIKLTLTL